MLAPIDPEVDKERSPGEGVSERDCECACKARNAFASSTSNSLGRRRSFSISDLCLGGYERARVLERKKKRDVRIIES